MSSAPEVILELRKVSKTYALGKVDVKALREVSLIIPRGEFVAIMGPSGSGKSTLLHILGCLDRPDSGQYWLQGKDVSRLGDDELANLRNQEAGFIFQQFHLLPRMTALENVQLPLIYGDHEVLREKAAKRLNQVGLADRKEHKPSELSGGQQQRVAIARSLINNPGILFADEPTGNLDSKSEEEIIAILGQLHAEGKTIILVTHEQEIAQQAERVIFMRDGRIVSDEPTGRARPGKQSALAAAGNGNGSGSGSERLRKSNIRKITQNIRQGFQALLGNKMRSFLSMLGILIGVASVIAMLALGKGAQVSIRERMSALGTNLLMIRPGAVRSGGASFEAGAVSRLTLQDAESLAGVPHVKGISPSVNGRAQAVHGNKNWNTQVQGVGLDYAQMKSAEPTQGRFFTPEEVGRREKVALLGKTVAQELFGDEDPVGAAIKINRIQFQVIGVLPEKGAGPRGDQDDVVVMPVTTAMYRLLGDKYVDMIEVEVDAMQNMDGAEEEIRNRLRRELHLKADEEDTFRIRNMAEIQEALEGMTKSMTMLLGFIAAISLLVGGIGIMNIMLVSVTERTREIGLRKAIGARRKDILLQFLIESMVMTFCGGIIGIAMGASAALLLSLIAGWTTQVSADSVTMATLFSILVGIVFGLWPAQKASKLNPIEALRYE